MVSLVVGYIGLSSFSLFAAQQAQFESAQLSITPPVKQLLFDNPDAIDSYKKSVQLFGEIQKLKDHKQDTTKLETIYADSVKNLSNQNQKVAEEQMHTLETEIAKMNGTLSGTPSPEPSLTGDTLTITPSPSVTLSPSPEETEDTEATGSAETE